MNTSTDLSTTPHKQSEPKLAASSVSITHAAPHDGRLPVTVTVTPLADLDAGGGVFVDLRRGTKHVDVKVPANRPTVHSAGNAAIDELATQEEAGASAESARDAATAAQKSAAGALTLSRQISPGCKLTLGPAETYRAEVSLPPDFDAADGWFVRCRFVSPDGNDLKSAWLRV